MERLTHKRVNGIKTGYWSPEKKQDLIDRLAEYEDTGLMSDEINALRDRDLAMKIKEIHVDEYYCPACSAENNCDQGIVGDKFCPVCGQRLKWEE